MATRTAKKINNWYLKYAELEMIIDMDEQGLFCQVPSECEENKLYSVRVDESMMVPTTESCDCKAFEIHHECKHCQIVSSFYKRIYRSTIAKAEAKAEATRKAEAEKAMADFTKGKVFDKELQCWIELPSEEPVDHFESLKGTRVGQRQEKESLMAQTRAENKRIKARRILAEQEVAEANDDILERHAELMRAGAYTMPLGELNGAQQSATLLMELPSRKTA